MKYLVPWIAVGAGFAASFPMFATANANQTRTTPVDRAIPAVPAGGMVVGDQVVFDGGRTTLSLGPAAYDDCPAGWVCLWEHRDFGGRMLKFQDCCTWQSLWTYSFANQASSSRNRKSVNAKIATGVGGAGTQLCLGANGHFVYLGDFHNDNAESINAGTAC